ncbi:hypothetical protein As57867_000987, partial [Aphanomyces stellatus]
MKCLAIFATAVVAVISGAELKSQSPIDLSSSVKPIVNAGNFSVAVSADKGVVLHDDHTIKTTWAAGPNSHLTLNGRTYNSIQFHPHVPSEHTIDGKKYPFEVHFVHADKDKNLAVVG